jgi:hypothetical protein
VTNENHAYKLLSLLDQIHLWSITEYRSFVTEHLRAWHAACEQNYHLEWNSIYDLGDDTKRVRVLEASTELTLPNWIHYLGVPQKQKLQARAKASLQKELLYRSARKGKALTPRTESPLICLIDHCNTNAGGGYAYLEHLKEVHKWDSQNISAMRYGLGEWEAKKHIERRQGSKVTPSGHRWDWPWDMPLMKKGEKIRFPLSFFRSFFEDC